MWVPKKHHLKPLRVLEAGHRPLESPMKAAASGLRNPPSDSRIRIFSWGPSRCSDCIQSSPAAEIPVTMATAQHRALSRFPVRPPGILVHLPSSVPRGLPSPQLLSLWPAAPTVGPKPPVPCRGHHRLARWLSTCCLQWGDKDTQTHRHIPAGTQRLGAGLDIPLL